MKNKIIQDFDSFSEIYNRWRLLGPFFKDYELKIGTGIVKIAAERFDNTKNIKLLDLGCGTGVWTQFINDMFNPRLSIGIDSSSKMIEKSKLNNKKGTIFFNCIECQQLIEENYYNVDFDLIISALSVDYIGIFTSINAIHSNLSKNGVGIFWFFDPERYTSQNSYVIKNWHFLDYDITLKSKKIEIKEINVVCENLGLHCQIFIKELPIVNRISRTLYYVVVSKSQIILDLSKLDLLEVTNKYKRENVLLSF